MNHFLSFLADCWLPLLTALLLAISLYQLGRADERHRQRRKLQQRIRRHHARSILLPMR